MGAAATGSDPHGSHPAAVAVLVAVACAFASCQPTLRPGDTTGTAVGRMDAAGDVTGDTGDAPGTDVLTDVLRTDAAQDAATDAVADATLDAAADAAMNARDTGVVDTGVDVPPACTGGTVPCSGACVQPLTDPTNCGACGNACGAGQICLRGTCATPTCPAGMVLIPGGTFMMGAADLAMYGATPVHRVTLSPYCMDVTEVTVAAYRACPTAAGCTSPGTGNYCNWTVTPGTGAANRENHPVNCVNWSQAQAYCQWVRGGGGDLPTEAQWEFAARGAAAEPAYPWGMAAPRFQLCWSGGTAGTRTGTCPVGTFSPGGDSPFGLQDMAGNVWEWIHDYYAVYDPAGLPVRDPTGPVGSHPSRVYRGGGWFSADPLLVRAATRGGDTSSVQGDNLGVRCARGF